MTSIKMNQEVANSLIMFLNASSQEHVKKSEIITEFDSVRTELARLNNESNDKFLGLGSKVSEIENRITTIENVLNNTNNRVANIENSVTRLESSMTSVCGKLDFLAQMLAQMLGNRLN